jgi:flagellin
MSRINTNVQSLIAQRVLNQNQSGLNTTLERLSTGTKINRGKDDPAGLIASEALRSDMKSINAAIGNAERADQVVNIAEGGLQEVSGLLTELQGLVTGAANTAGLSESEKSANQLQIDSILQAIDRIAGATTFQGVKLLNGNFDYKTSNVAAGISDLKVNGAKYNGANMDLNVNVTQSAQRGALFLDMGGANLNLGTGSSFVVEVGGATGSRELTFSSGTSLANISAAINNLSDVTGIEARVSGNGVRLFTSGYGDKEFVSVTVKDDGGLTGGSTGVYKMEATNNNDAAASGTAFSGATAAIRDEGQNLGATINGIVATASGKTARINTDFLDVSLSLTDSQSQTLGSVGTTRSAQITGGGADFMLGGKVDISNKVSLGVADVAVRKLGNSSDGFLASLASGKSNDIASGNFNDAQKIIASAIDQVSATRGRLGAFQKNTIGATIRSLNIASENTAAAESVIRDANFAAETANLTRSQILVNASTNVLSLANQSPQSALALLG